MADRLSLVEENIKIPTHILVQRQMQYLIQRQKSRVVQLELDISSQNDTIRDNFVAREQYDADLDRLQESLRCDYVPKDQYDKAVSQLEEERHEHSETRIRLQEVTDKLQVAMGEMELLTRQLDQEKTAYTKAFGSMKNKSIQETSKSIKLQSKCSEISRQCEKQEEILSTKTEEIQQLERKLKQQETLYKKEVTEAEIEKKQQRYIAQMMADVDRKKNRGSSMAVPKTKSQRR